MALTDALADLVLDARCPGCGIPALGACRSCRAVLERLSPFPVPGLAGVRAPVVAGGSYDGELRRLLLAAKERQALGLTAPLGARLAAAVAAWARERSAGGPVALVPVPTDRARAAERGLDLPLALARVAARRLRGAGLPVRVWRGLGLLRRPQDQSELDRPGRLANLAGAFGVRGRPPPADLVVVDDIVTTGATLAEAVRALGAGGCRAGAAATVAATPRWADVPRGAR